MGLSVTEFISTLTVSMTWRRASLEAPCTCDTQRNEYASCTFSQSMWCSIISLPWVRARIFLAVSHCPVCGRIIAMRGSKAARVPPRASRESAAAISAVFMRLRASYKVSAATAVIAWVPFINARPSLASRTIGLIPAASSTGALGTSLPLDTTCPLPRRTAAMCESGAKSPLEPTDPLQGMTG
jgi:hypothetical protein